MSTARALSPFKSLANIKDLKLRSPKLPPGGEKLLLAMLIGTDCLIETGGLANPKFSNLEVSLAGGVAFAATAYLAIDLCHSSHQAPEWSKGMKRKIAAIVVSAGLFGACAPDLCRTQLINWNAIGRGPYNPTTPDCVRVSFTDRSCAVRPKQGSSSVSHKLLQG